MKSFHEWVAEKNPEAIEEGFFKNLALGASIGAGAMGLGGKFLKGHGHPTSNRAAATQSDDYDEDDGERGMLQKERLLRAAAQKVGIPRSQWNNLQGRMVGGIVVTVNGKKVPLTPKEAQHVKDIQALARSMGN